jgi:hypothetical protein
VPDLAKLFKDHPLYARLLHASTLGYVPITGQLVFQRALAIIAGDSRVPLLATDKYYIIISAGYINYCIISIKYPISI